VSLAFAGIGLAGAFTAVNGYSQTSSPTPINCGANPNLPSCQHTIKVEPIQGAPAYFKFQARVSQARIPVGESLIKTVYVNVRDGEDKASPLCTEVNTEGVRIRDSVLNLEIGRRQCKGALEQAIARGQTISFEVCLNDPGNCLKPVQLASVPYAIKSNVAVKALESNRSNEAVECHYAHYITADKDIHTSQSIGKGSSTSTRKPRCPHVISRWTAGYRR
jgi:hypothetical protein